LEPKPSIPEALAEWVLTHRILVILCAGILAVPALLLTASVNIDNSTTIWFQKDNPHYREYQRFLKEFGSDRFFLVAYTNDALFTTSALQALKGLRDDIRSLEGVEKVVTLLDAPVVTWTPVGPTMGPFLEPIPSGEGALQKARSAALATPLFINNLISKDGRTAYLFTSIRLLDLAEKQSLIREVREILRAADPAGGEILVAGGPLVEVEFDRLTRRENAIFIPLSLSVVILTLMFLFRSVKIVLLAAPALLLGIAVTISVFTLTGRCFNLVTSLIPPLLLAIGVADCVHILVHYREELAKGLEQRAALIRAQAEMFRPCLFTSLTTAAGFGSLAAGNIPPVREAGVIGGAGILLVFAVAFTLFPAAISFLGEKHFLKRREGSGGSDGITNLVLLRVYGAAKRGKWFVLGGAGVGILFAVTGVLQLNPETNIMDFFRKSNRIRAMWGRLEEQGMGLIGIEVVLRGEKGALREPEIYEAIRRAQTRVETHAEVMRTFSAVDILDHASGSMGGKGTEASRKAIRKSVLALLGDQAFRKDGPFQGIVTEDASTTRVTVRVPSGGSGQRLQQSYWIREVFREEIGEEFRIEITGIAPLLSRIDQLIATSQVRMALVAGITIFLMTLILLRSVRLGALAMIPNLLPVMMTIGLMGWAEIPLDVGTMIIAGVAVGIAVDDTIHYLTRYEREREGGAGAAQALERSHKTVGHAIVFTSIILFMGFSIIGLSSFRPVSTFGLLTGLTMILALVGDLFLLPAILLVRVK
jgi:predicted RND superfamily exporter protein